jgi:hypothetical protein
MANTSDLALTNVPLDSRWLNWTRGVAFCSLTIAAVTMAFHADAQDLAFLVPTAPLWLPFLWMLMRLMGKTAKSQKSGLAMAVVLGPGSLIFSSLIAVKSDTYRWRAGLVIYAVLHLLLVVSAIKTYYSMKREPSDRVVLLNRLVGGFFAFIVAAILIPHMLPSRIAGDEASAVGAMRSINRAQSTYAEKHPDQGFAATLSELGQASSADIIDQQLASGRKMQYTFATTASPEDSRGRITKYTVVARPGRFGRDGVRSFFADESGLIRATGEDRPPTVLDPTL